MIVVIPLVIVLGILVWVLRPRKGLTGSGRLAMLVTLIPPFAVALAAIIFQLLHNSAGTISVSDISNTLFVTGLGFIGVAILAIIGFALKRQHDVARIIGFSVCLAAIAYAAVFGVLEWLGGV